LIGTKENRHDKKPMLHKHKRKTREQTSNQTKNLRKYKNGSTTHQGWGRGNGRGVRVTFPTKGKVSIEMDSKIFLKAKRK
jgi:hypothetical protein